MFLACFATFLKRLLLLTARLFFLEQQQQLTDHLAIIAFTALC